MGRYVTGDFDWKFALGEQNSSFGEVLEEIVDGIGDNEDSDIYLHRYIETKGEGEKLELVIENRDQFINACREYIGEDFKVIKESKKILSQEYWDKLMIWKFLKQHNNFDDMELDDCLVLNFNVEY